MNLLNNAGTQSGFTRRGVLLGGLGGIAVFGVGGFVAARLTDGSPDPLTETHFFGAGEQLMFARLADVFLGKMLPADADKRALIINKIVSNVDAGILAFSPALQKETTQLTKMLAFAPTRFLLTKQWTGWQTISNAEIKSNLEALRDSDSNLKRTVFRALRDLTMAAFYGDRMSWEVIAYPGPVIDFGADSGSQ